MVKNLLAMQENWLRSLGQEDRLQKGMATQSSILPGEFHGQRSLAGYSIMGHKELDMTKQLSTYKKIRFRHKEKERFLLYIFWLCS